MTTSPKSPDDDLRALAERADQGEWFADMDAAKVIATDPGGTFINDHRTVALCATGDLAYRNAAFIAAFNPQTAIALLNERDALRERLAEAERQIREICGIGADMQDALSEQQTRAETAEAALASQKASGDRAEEERDEAMAAVGRMEFLLEDARKHEDAAEERARKLDEALRGMFCPRPANDKPDDLDVRDCVACGDCGCIAGSALTQSERTP